MTASKTADVRGNPEEPWAYEKLHVRREGSVVFADDRLYLYSENGVVGLAEANPAGYREHGRFEIRSGRLPTWSHPVVSGGKLFIRDQDTIYAYDVRAR